MIDGKRFRVSVQDYDVDKLKEKFRSEAYQNDDQKSLYIMGFYVGLKSAFTAKSGQFVPQAIEKEKKLNPWVEGYNDGVRILSHYR